jgi:hypothetical protein
LHAAYEMLGPDVAYFLGGAIALHPKGHKAGARLCVNILDEARKLAEYAKKKHKGSGDPLNETLITEIETYSKTAGKVWYQRTEGVFAPPGFAPFYKDW